MTPSLLLDPVDGLPPTEARLPLRGNLSRNVALPPGLFPGDIEDADGHTLPVPVLVERYNKALETIAELRRQLDAAEANLGNFVLIHMEKGLPMPGESHELRAATPAG